MDRIANAMPLGTWGDNESLMRIISAYSTNTPMAILPKEYLPLAKTFSDIDIQTYPADMGAVLREASQPGLKKVAGLKNAFAQFAKDLEPSILDVIAALDKMDPEKPLLITRAAAWFFGPLIRKKGFQKVIFVEAHWWSAPEIGVPMFAGGHTDKPYRLNLLASNAFNKIVDGFINSRIKKKYSKDYWDGVEATDMHKASPARILTLDPSKIGISSDRVRAAAAKGTYFTGTISSERPYSLGLQNYVGEMRQEGRSIILVSLGSSNAEFVQASIQESMEQLKGLLGDDLAFIVVTKDNEEQRLARNIFTSNYVSYANADKIADFAITHGGSGTASLIPLPLAIFIAFADQAKGAKIAVDQGRAIILNENHRNIDWASVINKVRGQDWNVMHENLKRAQAGFIRPEAALQKALDIVASVDAGEKYEEEI